jgi:hypothetical protein
LLGQTVKKAGGLSRGISIAHRIERQQIHHRGIERDVDPVGLVESDDHESGHRQQHKRTRHLATISRLRIPNRRKPRVWLTMPSLSAEAKSAFVAATAGASPKPMPATSEMANTIANRTPIRRDVEVHRKGKWELRLLKRTGSPKRKQYAPCASNRRQQRTFGRQLAYQTETACAH